MPHAARKYSLSYANKNLLMKFQISLLLSLLLLVGTSCTTQKDVAYFQDITAEGTLATQAEKFLTILPGDKLSILVNSATTPEQAERFNLRTVSSTSGSNQQNQTIYTVSEDGTITVPGLEPVKVTGMTRSELSLHLQELLRKELLHDAVVNVNCTQRYVTVLGEVSSPGRYEFARESMNILELLGMAGDIAIQGKRTNIMVIREEQGEKHTYFLDIRSKDIFQSPAFYLQQNDVVYVTPNRFRRGQSTVNGTSLRSIGTWIGTISGVTSIVILITNALRK